MIKKKNISSNYILWIFITLIIVPINLSYNNFDDFAFDAFQPKNELTLRYLFTLPISFFFIFPIIILGVLNLNKDREIFLFYLFILISIINFYFNKNISYFILIIKIFLPISLMLGFEVYFTKKISFYNKQNLFQFVKNINNKIYLVFMITFFLSIISPLYLENSYRWLINEIVIYDYYQYYPLIFIFLLGILAANKNIILFIIVYFLVFFLASQAINNTLFFVLVIFGIYYFFSFFFRKNKKNIVFYSRIFISFSIFFIFFYQIFIIIYSQTSLLDFANEMSSLRSRFNLASAFYFNINIIEFFTPIRLESSVIASKYYHNEFIVLTSSIGILGAFLFYFIFFKRIWLISLYYPEVSVAVSLVTFLSGNVVTVNLHPYTLIISTFLISYYYVLSKLQVRNQINYKLNSNKK